eukprot:291713-Chlamydomonas_euryale.AAC.5
MERRDRRVPCHTRNTCTASSTAGGGAHPARYPLTQSVVVNPHRGVGWLQLARALHVGRGSVVLLEAAVREAASEQRTRVAWLLHQHPVKALDGIGEAAGRLQGGSPVWEVSAMVQAAATAPGPSTDDSGEVTGCQHGAKSVVGTGSMDDAGTRQSAAVTRRFARSRGRRQARRQTRSVGHIRTVTGWPGKDMGQLPEQHWAWAPTLGK